MLHKAMEFRKEKK